MKPTKEEMIEKIYEVIGGLETYVKSQSVIGNMDVCYGTRDTYTKKKMCMIGDVLDWIDWLSINKLRHNRNRDSKLVDVVCDICSSREYKRKPIENQSDFVIEFIYSLIQEND